VTARLLKLQENMVAETPIREEIKRRFRPHFAQNHSEICGEHPKPFQLGDVTMLERKFVYGQCQVSQIDRRAAAVFYCPQNIAIPNCPIVRTNDC